MARSPTEEPSSQKSIKFPDSLWERLENLRYEKRIPSVAETLRLVVDAGIKAMQHGPDEPKSAPPKKAAKPKK